MHYTGMKSKTFISCGFADWILFCKFGAWLHLSVPDGCYLFDNEIKLPML